MENFCRYKFDIARQSVVHELIEIIARKNFKKGFVWHSYHDYNSDFNSVFVIFARNFWLSIAIAINILNDPGFWGILIHSIA